MIQNRKNGDKTETGQSRSHHRQEASERSSSLAIDACMEKRTCFLLPLIEIGEKERKAGEAPFMGATDGFRKTKEDDVQKVVEFDQLQYLSFLEHRHKLQQATRMNYVREGYILQKKEDYSDEDLQKEMFEMYGELDTTSPEYKKLFATYKESFLEEFEEFEEIEREGVKRGSGLGCIYEGSKVLNERMEDVFGQDQLAMFLHLDPRTNESGADWFKLPRPLKKWGEEFLDTAVAKMSARKLQKVHELELSSGGRRHPPQDGRLNFDDEEDDDITKLDLLDVNLSVLDPKYWNFHLQKYTSTVSDINVLLALCWKLNELIHKWPYGMSCETMLSYFKHETGYRLHYKKLGFSDARTLFDSLQDIFHVMKPAHPKGKSLLFPAAFKGLIPDRTVFDMRVTHYLIMAVMNERKGFVKISDVPDLLWKHFGIRIICSEWGYLSTLDFVQDYTLPISSYVDIVEFWHRKDDYEQRLKKNECLPDRSYLESFLFFKHFPGVSENFSIYRSENEDLEIREIGKLGLTMPRFLRISPSAKFLTNVEKLGSTSEMMVPGRLLACQCMDALNPSSFYVTAVSDFSRLKNLHVLLQKKVWYDKKLQPANLAELLCLGQLVIVKTRKGLDEDWCRGVVTEIKNGKGANDKFRVRVRELDTGYYNWATLDNLALMPRDIGESIRAAAIQCRLQFNDPVLCKKEVDEWTLEEESIFAELLHLKSLSIRFESVSSVPFYRRFERNQKSLVDGITFSAEGRLYYPLVDTRIWTVTATVIDEVEGKEIVIVPDVALEFKKRRNQLMTEKV